MGRFLLVLILLFFTFTATFEVEAKRGRGSDNDDRDREEPRVKTPAPTQTTAPTLQPTATPKPSPIILPLNNAYVTEAPTPANTPVTPHPTLQFKKIAGVVSENPRNTPASIFVTLLILGSFGYLLSEYKDFSKLQKKLPFKKHL